MDKSDLPPELQEDRIAWVELLHRTSARDWLRDNFGLYAPPGDYLSLRRENLRRSLDPSRISRRPK
jgi:hypothetical protein